ncbi:Codanin-1 [Frankliniella fusca]|uniref:Codanin-1 n=1 Tax=Frankliniella fusca TaxID=407009 RepID=A0AAE1L5R3_9NEOP|nr:Codanin-1 [Frankliniella fusca]
MAEEVLFDTLEGSIPLEEVLEWISNDTYGPTLQERVNCSRGDLVLFVLNLLRDSTVRAWIQSNTFQSPLKSISKASKFNSSSRRPSPMRSEKKSARRVELFPKVESSTSVRNDPETDLNSSKGDSWKNHSGPQVNSSTPYKNAFVKSSCPRPREERNPFLVAEETSPLTSSPISTPVASGNSPQFTPISKRVQSFKSAERRSPPVPINSPDHQIKTHTRSNGVCLGDFLIKSSKSMQSKKRFPQSPPRSPTTCQDVSPSEHLNSSSTKKKHKRRINPTKVSLENSPPPQCGFQKTVPFGIASSNVPESSPFQSPVSVEPVGASHSFSEERNLLKQERLKLQSLGESSNTAVPAVSSAGTSKITLPKTVVIADPSKVTFCEKILKLSELYCGILNANLMPNLMSELYFVVSLLVIRTGPDEEEKDCGLPSLEDHLSNVSLKVQDHTVVDSVAEFLSPVKKRRVSLKEICTNQYFYSVHNCVFFATHVLLNQIGVLCNLDRITLKFLLDSERVATFSPDLKKEVQSLYSNCLTRNNVPQGVMSMNSIANVSFQSDTDNSSNFPSAQCFSNFRKQRDGFYELLRVWEANHLKQGWCFATSLGSRVRSLVHLCSDPVNLMHFARLFRLQLVSVVGGGSKILTSFLASDTEDSDLTVDGATRQNYLSCVITMRLLAKFLGLVVFLPYSRTESNLPHNILETEVSVRSKVVPPVSIMKCITEALKTQRLTVTIPWVVKFLGMMDSVSCALPVYQAALQLLLHLYAALRQGSCGELLGKKIVLPPQNVLLLRLSLGWLFEASFIQEHFFFTWCFNLDESLMLMSLDIGDTSYSEHSFRALESSDILSVSSTSAPSVDALNLVDCEVLYALCPFLLELRALLASTPSDCALSGSVRHITPVSAGSLLSSSSEFSGKQLELKLEDSFFHGLPASVHRTVEFVVERVTSSCVKYICNVWLPGLKQQGVLKLQDKIRSYQADPDSDIDISAMQNELKKEINLIVEQVALDLKAKCRSGVGEFCLSKCRGALLSLLPEESLSIPVCDMCVSIASRMSEERVITWLQSHATLSLYSKDLQTEVEKSLKNRERLETVATAKTSHVAPGANATWKHDDSAPSPCTVLQPLKLMVCDILNGQDVSREEVNDILDKMELCVTRRQDVVPAAERIFALLSVDLVIALVCHNPRMIDSSLLSRLIMLWKLDALRPVEDGLARLVCPRNMLLLAQSNHPTRLVWEKLAEVVAAVLKANLVTPDLVENQCLAIMQQEWPQNILRCFAMCMNEVVRQYQKQKDVDYKFVLLLEWLAETMAQMDYFPHL